MGDVPFNLVFDVDEFLRKMKTLKDRVTMLQLSTQEQVLRLNVSEMSKCLIPRIS